MNVAVLRDGVVMSDIDHDPLFDLGEHEDEVAEMRRVQDEIDADIRLRKGALSEALFLLAVCDDVRVQRLAAMKRAEVRLSKALDAFCASRESLAEASDLEITAMRAVSLLRGHAVGAVDRALSSVQEQL